MAKDFQWARQMRHYNKNYVSMDKVGLFKYVPDRNNKILTQEFVLNLNSKKTCKNNNTFIISDSSADLAEHYIIPNVLQANTNYIIMDPGARVYEKTQAHLTKEGYSVQVFNLTPDTYPNQVCLNPLDIAESYYEKEKLFETYIESAKNLALCSENLRKAEIYLLMAILGWTEEWSLWNDDESLELITGIFTEKDLEQLEEAVAEASVPSSIPFFIIQRIFHGLTANISKHPEYMLAELDLLMNSLYNVNPTSKAYSYYKLFKQYAAHDFYSVLLSTHLHLSLFDIKQCCEATNKTNIDFKSLVQDKTALFVILPKNDTSYDAIASVFLHSVISHLQKTGDDYTDRRFPRMLSTFFNFNRCIFIPDLEQKMITGHKRGLFFNVFYGALKNIKYDYPLTWEVIMDTCDTLMYFGCEDMEFREYFKEYLPHIIQSESIILIPSEICFLLIRGMDPICNPKYRAEQHPNYPK